MVCTNLKHDDKNVAISGMQKLLKLILMQKCRNQWCTNSEDEIGTVGFMLMEENTTTVTKLQNKFITKLQEIDITLMGGVPRRRTKIRGKKWKMTLWSHTIEEEGMSWKTTMWWCVNISNKRRTQKNGHQLISTISRLSMHHHATIWNDKIWKWD